MKSFFNGAYLAFRSFVVNYLQANLENDVGLAFIYFNYKEQQTLTHVLGSLLQQLIQQQERVSREISALYGSCDDGKRPPTSGELATLLQSQSQFFSKLFIVIDALDECSYNATPELLLQLQKLRPSLHLLITSRSHVGNVIQQFLPDANRLEIRAHDEDIKKYLDKRIRIERHLGPWVTKSPDLGETIKEKIAEKAKGMSVHPYPLSRFL